MQSCWSNYDVVAYAVHIAAQLSAHIIKTKLPTAELVLEESRKVYEERHIFRDVASERVRRKRVWFDHRP